MNLEDVVIMHESKVDAWKQSKSREPPSCIYCGHFVTRQRVEFDHFPIPKSGGGTEVVSACETCHSMKDRFKIDSWPIHMGGVIYGDGAVLAPLFTAIMARDGSKIRVEAARWREFWDELSPGSRIAFGKLVAVATDVCRVPFGYRLAPDNVTLAEDKAEQAIMARYRAATPPTPQSDT
jgi:hypothetical protein